MTTIPNWLVLKNFLTEETCLVAEEHMRMSIANNYTLYGHINRYASNGYSWDLYSSPFTDSLGLSKVPEINKIINDNVSLSYTMLRQYDRNSKLQWHRDRWECEFSVSCQISPEPWGMEFGESGQKLHAGEHDLLIVERGDAIFYLGPQVFHSRKKLPHSKHIQIFLHYVLKGSTLDTRDHRPEYGLDGTFRRQLEVVNGN
tara:strand:- start:636 stop:1238 length:603 start_codon:yes stop_codon:yes gene_type:complete